MVIVKSRQADISKLTAVLDVSNSALETLYESNRLMFPDQGKGKGKGIRYKVV